MSRPDPVPLTSSALWFLNALDQGHRSVMTPHTVIRLDTHRAERTLDESVLLNSWEVRQRADPFYNPNLTDSHEDFGLEL